MGVIVKKLNIDQLSCIYDTYLCRQFSADEVKPFKNICKMWDEGVYSALGLFDNEQIKEESNGERFKDGVNSTCLNGLIGYALFVTPKSVDVVLLDYYAIIETYQSKGMGSVFLSGMKKYFINKRAILLETEDVDFVTNAAELEQRERRNRFYIVNGAKRADIKTEVYGVNYEIWSLSTGDSLTREEVMNGLVGIYETMFSADIMGNKVRIIN